MPLREGDEVRFNMRSGYRALWQFALFDLPTLTKRQRREYTRFRKLLLNQGFTMLQYSVYARYCRSEESAEWIREAIRKELPPSGQVRLVSITDRQFGKMEVFFGKLVEEVEDAPEQLLLF